jgi:hypothetical protein
MNPDRHLADFIELMASELDAELTPVIEPGHRTA